MRIFESKPPPQSGVMSTAEKFSGGYGNIILMIPGAYEPPKAANECVTTVPSKYKMIM